MQFVASRKVRKPRTAAPAAAKADPVAAANSMPSATTAAAAEEEEEDEEDDDEPAAPVDMDDLLPRTDISPLITTKLLTAMGSGNPKERMKAVDDLEEVLRGAGGRIQPNVGDLMPALKVRAGVHLSDLCGSLDFQG